jgi:NADH-quinone oxidoreductase subunit C
MNISITEAHGEVSLEVECSQGHGCLQLLHDQPDLCFEQLIDLCGVDYLDYGKDSTQTNADCTGPRFAVVYHLLSVSHNHRLRVVVRLEEESLTVDSVIDIWPVADWFEREAFDLFGIIFIGHPDLRRLLTDYGFVGHPFRKDFPLSGHVEMRYDEEKGRVVYEPVSIEPRVTVPRVIREGGGVERNP